MKHLNHVESVELGFWSQELNPYPSSWRDSSLQGSAQEEQLSRLHHSSSKANPGQLLLICMPCIPNSTSLDDEDEPSPLGNLENIMIALRY
jgi:hypothetical protein